ncbi:hypothetical protein IB691_02050, partial [Fangia hongkongensis]|nr:hypothetical protein [Fangia hongkongensis]
MLTLDEDEIIQKIKNNECFSAQNSTGSFVITINAYVPYLATAIHAGKQISKEMEDCYT